MSREREETRVVGHSVRSQGQRIQDTLARLSADVDAWVATANPDNAGEPYLVPLSFYWDGSMLLLATAESTRSARNVAASERVRLALGTTRDVILIDGKADAIPTEDIDDAEADAFAAKAGFDPRTYAGRYCYLRVHPQWIQAWRNVPEQVAGPLMRDGKWLA
jgi:hypothetical protein